MQFETDGVLAFSRAVAKELGVSAALLYNHLLYEHNYWEQKGKLDDEGYFWEDQVDIAEWILVHKNSIGKIADTLVEAGLIQKKVSYKPGTTIRTTKWKIVISEVSKMRISEDSKTRISILKEKTNKIELSSEITKSELAEDNHKSEDGSSFADGDDGEVAAAARMKPEALNQRLKMIYKVRSATRTKERVAAVKKLQAELPDDDIIKAATLLARKPMKDVSGTQWRPDYMWVTNPEKTSKVLDAMSAALNDEAYKEANKDKPKINFNTSYCY